MRSNFHRSFMRRSSAPLPSAWFGSLFFGLLRVVAHLARGFEALLNSGQQRFIGQAEVSVHRPEEQVDLRSGGPLAGLGRGVDIHQRELPILQRDAPMPAPAALAPLPG